MLLNLLLNAIAAIEEGGRITLRSESSSTGTGLRIVVQDDGCGVPDSLRDSLFEPYVTGREGGTGLGLAICRRIAIDHGFTLDFEDAPCGGTRMVITVPEEHA
jgi:signal transduction histidine kinase